jgi:hypothetical protein
VANGAVIVPAAVSLPVGATYQVVAANAANGNSRTSSALPIVVRRIVVILPLRAVGAGPV